MCWSSVVKDCSLELEKAFRFKKIERTAFTGGINKRK